MIDGGKAGILVAVDAETGKPIWKTEVGVHNGHQNDNSPPLHGDFSKLQAPVDDRAGRPGWHRVTAGVRRQDRLCRGQQPPLPLSSDDGRLSAVSFRDPSRGTGDIVAVDEATGKIKWDNRLPYSAYGAATLTNDVLFTTTFDGTLYAFNTKPAPARKAKLSAGTNTPVAVFGDTVVAARESAPARPKAVDHRLPPRGEEPAPDRIPVVHHDDRIQPHHHELHGDERGDLRRRGRREHGEPRGPGRPLAFTANQETANAGKVTVDFTNNSALEHDIVLTDSQNKIVGQTPVFQGGSKSFTATIAPAPTRTTARCPVTGRPACREP